MRVPDSVQTPSHVSPQRKCVKMSARGSVIRKVFFLFSIFLCRFFFLFIYTVICITRVRHIYQLQTQLQDDLLMTLLLFFLFIFYLLGSPYRIFLLDLLRLPYHSYLVVIEQQQQHHHIIFLFDLYMIFFLWNLDICTRVE